MLSLPPNDHHHRLHVPLVYISFLHPSSSSSSPSFFFAGDNHTVGSAKHVLMMYTSIEKMQFSSDECLASVWREKKRGKEREKNIISSHFLFFTKRKIIVRGGSASASCIYLPQDEMMGASLAPGDHLQLLLFSHRLVVFFSPLLLFLSESPEEIFFWCCNYCLCWWEELQHDSSCISSSQDSVGWSGSSSTHDASWCGWW